MVDSIARPTLPKVGNMTVVEGRYGSCRVNEQDPHYRS
jgi:hypothetical protein